MPFPTARRFRSSLSSPGHGSPTFVHPKTCPEAAALGHGVRKMTAKAGLIHCKAPWESSLCSCSSSCPTSIAEHGKQSSKGGGWEPRVCLTPGSAAISRDICLLSSQGEERAPPPIRPKRVRRMRTTLCLLNRSCQLRKKIASIKKTSSDEGAKEQEKVLKSLAKVQGLIKDLAGLQDQAEHGHACHQ